MAESPKLPRLCHHKPSNRAYVRVRNRFVYLGRWGDPETDKNYETWLAEYLASRRRIADPREILTVAELMFAYLEHAETYYRAPNGQATSQLTMAKNAVRGATTLYADLPATEFGPLKLKAVRERWIDAGLCRKTINEYVNILRAVYKWGASEEIVPETVWRALTSVAGLRYGRTAAKESREVKPVPEKHIEKVRQVVTIPVRALIDLQLLTGARPGELLALRSTDIDRSGRIWVATLKHHKTAYRRRIRTLYFGPQAQSVLRPFLLRRALEEPLFSPREAERERYDACTVHRLPNQKPTARRTKRTLGDSYTVNGYRHAIEYACKRAGVPTWHPYQLRHNSATRIRKEFGLEAAQAILGHARADVTVIYAEVNTARRRVKKRSPHSNSLC